MSVQSKPEGLRPRGVDDVIPSLSATEDEMRCPSQICEAGKMGQIPPSSAFCSMQAVDGQVDAHPLERAVHSTESTHSPANLI